ncbi:hypothetical protein GCM10020220_084120 [Nonomuraea rubra]
MTAYVGEVFGGVLALKTAGAEEAAWSGCASTTGGGATPLSGTEWRPTCWCRDHHDDRAQHRARAAARRALHARGDFTVGDLALFTSYIGWLTALPRSIGTILYRLPQAARSQRSGSPG